MAASFPRTFSPSFPVTAGTGLTETQKKVLAGARSIADLMDNRFSVLGFRFGLESIVGLVPGVGDVVAATASLYLLGAAVQLKVPPSGLARMAAITVTDLLFGLVPFLGDAVDAVFKSHMRNLRIIEKHVEKLETRAGRS